MHGLFERVLWFGLGTAGLIVALIAWLLIALAMTLDVTVESLFRWMGPVFSKIEPILRKQIAIFEQAESLARSNGYTPLQQDRGGTPPGTPGQMAAPEMPAVTTTSGARWRIDSRGMRGSTRTIMPRSSARERM